MGKRFHVGAGDFEFLLDSDPLVPPIPVQDAPKVIEGPAGPPGKDGKDGKDGLDGAHGKDGRNGKDGKDGRPGPQGDRGPKGDPGEKGKDGKEGPEGKAGTNGTDGNDGAPGVNGWTPVLALEARGDRVLLRVIDWLGGEGDKPALGYVTPSGIIDDPNRAVNLRGPAGPAGRGSIFGGGGGGGLPGYAGWSPVFAVEEDGERSVLKVADWFGGEGDKPASGQYVGETGFVDDIADGADIRGASGSGGGGGPNSLLAALTAGGY